MLREKNGENITFGLKIEKSCSTSVYILLRKLSPDFRQNDMEITDADKREMELLKEKSQIYIHFYNLNIGLHEDVTKLF